MNVVPLLPSAVEYQGLGLALLPAKFREKKPAIRTWKEYQTHRADDAKVREWFDAADSSQLGIAIVCGEVSGGLLVRDFDEREAYANWKRSNRSLARKLPTVETGRGFQVYCRAEGYKPATSRTFVHNYSDGSGELRGDGHYVIAPPSLHQKTGKPYRWINPLVDLPLVDLEVFGVTPSDGECNSLMSVLHPGPPSPAPCLCIFSRCRNSGNQANPSRWTQTAKRQALSIRPSPEGHP